MTIKQYFEKIKALRTAEDSNHTDLDNLVMKILLDNNSFNFNLSDLEFTNDQKVDVQEIILNPEIINQISDSLDLLFISEKETQGNVCFINSTELRPEFRQSFTAINLLDYIYAFMHSSFYKEFQKIDITSETGIFWELIKIGADLRKKINKKQL